MHVFNELLTQTLSHRRENYNQEVDIEVSRWNIRDNEDVQFLVR